ncbi:MAG: glycosyltransferase [Bacteroidota bacterium]
MSPPLVSILLASQDGARHLAEALESVAGQTYPSIELVLVDDGSTDATGAILREFARSRANARVLTSGGEGLAAALALAAQAASGPLLARHDDDDRSRPDRIARQVEHLRTHPGDGVVGTSAVLIDDAGAAIGPYPVPTDPGAIRRALRRGTPFVHGSILMRREVYERAGGYRAAFRASQDYDLWLRLPPEAGLANLPERLYEWRFHPGGVFARRRPEQIYYAAVSRAFAEERAAAGSDSIALLEGSRGDRAAFLERYPRADRLRTLWGERLVREGRVGEARRILARAFSSPRSFAPALGWWALSWPVGLLPRARRHGRAPARARGQEGVGTSP